jgi:hypothetical protein
MMVKPKGLPKFNIKALLFAEWLWRERGYVLSLYDMEFCLHCGVRWDWQYEQKVPPYPKMWRGLGLHIIPIDEIEEDS